MPADHKRVREIARHPYVWIGLLVCSLAGAGIWLGSGCGGWEVREPLMRNAPEVDEAIRLMDAGNYDQAAELLESYLGTSACQGGEIEVPPRARERGDGSFDLGLVLFHIGEKYGERFGEEEKLAEGSDEPPELDERRVSMIDCALEVAKIIAGDRTLPAELRARAYYLAGNLEFLRREYQAAVDHYDLALQLIPGIADDADGDPLGRDAAWNRAIALRRLQEEPDAAPPDAEPDAEPDGGGEGDKGDGGQENQDQENQDQGDQESADAGGGGGEPQDQDAGADQNEDDAGGDEQQESGGDEEDRRDMGPIAESGEESPEESRMRQILEELEDAPTYQQEEAKRMRGNRGRRVLEDK